MSDFRLVKFIDAPVQVIVPINPMGVYSNTTSYNVGDSVSYNGISYICILPSLGNVPTNTTYWQVIADIPSTFETVSKNLKAYSAALNYTSGKLTTVVYNLGGGDFITKTLGYTGNKLTTVVLSGSTPFGITLTKTLNYTGNDLTSFSYS